MTTERPGMTELLSWMDENGFYYAPCSGKYHLAKTEGLAEHSLNVLRHALDFVQMHYMKQGKPVTFEFINAVTICSLLHDLGKTGQFGKPNYIPDPATGLFKTNPDLLYIPHEVRSVAIASRFIELTEEEQYAIIYHNGLYGELKGFKGNEIPLYLIISYADMWASRITESEQKK